MATNNAINVGVVPGGGNTYTFPASSDTLVGRDTTDTLTNKTLTSPVLNTGVSGTAILDEDNMASDSATQLATQQSIKAYADTKLADVVEDTTPQLGGDLDANGNNITGAGDIAYDTATGTVSALGNLGASEAIDWSAATHFTGTLDANVTITHTNETSGRKISLYLSYDGSAQRTITWSDVDTWLDNVDGSAPATPSASGQVLVVTMQFIGTTCYAVASTNYS